MSALLHRKVDDPAQVVITKIHYKCANDNLQVDDYILARAVIAGNELDCPAKILETRESGLWFLNIHLNGFFNFSL